MWKIVKSFEFKEFSILLLMGTDNEKINKTFVYIKTFFTREWALPNLYSLFLNLSA